MADAHWAFFASAALPSMKKALPRVTEKGLEFCILKCLFRSVVASNLNVDFERYGYFGVKFDLNVLLA